MNEPRTGAIDVQDAGSLTCPGMHADEVVEDNLRFVPDPQPCVVGVGCVIENDLFSF